MASCYICSETLKLPVCLPCGHVFCSQCILTMVQTVKPPTPMHRCPTCRSWYNIAPLDTKTIPSSLRPFVTPSVRPLCVDVMQSDSKTESTAPPGSSWTFNESSMQTSAIRSSSMSCPAAGPSDDKVLSDMARLRAENHALRNHCSMWRKRAEAHGETNLNLLKFARAIRDQASQIARDRNELEQRCFLLKQQLDGDKCYSDEMQKYGKSSQPPAAESERGLIKQDDQTHHPVPLPPLSGPMLPSRTGPRSTILDFPPRKRSRTSVDGEGE